MKKILVLILLLSLGLNISLGMRQWQEERDFNRFIKEKMHGKPFDHRAPGGKCGPGGCPDGDFWQGVMKRRLAHVTNLLGLNSQQAEAFQKTHQEAAQRFLAQRVKVQEARHQLMEAASAAEMDVDTLRFLMAEAGRQQVKLDSMVTETMLKEMEILDAGQRLQYMRILPINRFSGQNDDPDPRARHRGGRPRH